MLSLIFRILFYVVISPLCNVSDGYEYKQNVGKTWAITRKRAMGNSITKQLSSNLFNKWNLNNG